MAYGSFGLIFIMQWSSWSEFFNMGGFGLYVWGSYGISFVLLGVGQRLLFVVEFFLLGDLRVTSGSNLAEFLPIEIPCAPFLSPTILPPHKPDIA